MVPDDARLRLQTLAAPPDLVPDAGVPRGWPTAPDGTPGARLQVGEGFDERGFGPGLDDGGAAPVRGRPAARSAWDEPRRGVGRWLPASWLSARWDPGGWGAIGLAVVAALAAVAAAVGVWAGRPVAEPVPPLPAVSAGAPVRADTVPSAAAPTPGGPVVVNVAGKVRRPGLVTMKEGARVGEAVDAAGGALPNVDLTPLNLAARVVDGQQILVGVAAPPGAAAPGPSAGSPAGSGAAPAPGGKLDLNAATLEQLDGLPGVGPVMAKKILDWRTQNGRFSAVEQLREIPGIGDARFGTLRDLVRV
ncbi:MAG: competence protein ComEA [Actinomycetota bacterium]|nr:competence protein ComEA [Actinomycetota bacterium]